jgi:hypothetical protein
MQGLLTVTRALPALVHLTFLWLWGNDQRSSVDEALWAWSKKLASTAYEPEGGWKDDDDQKLDWLLEEEPEPDFVIPYADSSSSEEL